MSSTWGRYIIHYALYLYIFHFIALCDVYHVNITEIVFTRYLSTDGAIENERLSVEIFNNFYNFKECYLRCADRLKVVMDVTNFVVALPLRTLMKCYVHFVKKDLRLIGDIHGIKFHETRNDDMISRMTAHECSRRCQDIIYVFKSRSSSRTTIPAQFCSVITGLTLNRTFTDLEQSPMMAGDYENEANEAWVDLSHLRIPDKELKSDLIRRWEKEMDSESLRIVVCAVCSAREYKSQTIVINGGSVDLTLLRNDELPAYLRPKSYNFHAYKRAFLNVKGLRDKNLIGEMVICNDCYESLTLGVMPKFALCNWLYYGKENLPEDIRDAFRNSSMFERMLIARARCNSVCCKFKMSDPGNGSEKLSGLRKGIRGNIMVAPLDVVRMHKVLPPKIDHRDTMTAVIVGNKMPSRATISKLGPVLVRKSRIQALLTFLLNNNPHYAPCDDLSFSQENLDAIHDSEDEPDIPKTVIIGQLYEDDGTEAINADYTPRNEDELIDVGRLNELVMENVGYTEGDNSATSYHAMKVLALERCLSGKPFIASGTGSRLVPDFNNPSILTWLFPHLDPWGIGGFHEPRRRVKLSMKEQLTHMLKSDELSFEEDPEFGFVFYNILRKADVSRTVRFQVPRKQQRKIIRELKSVNPDELRKLCDNVERDPAFRPNRSEQKRIMRLMRLITMSTHSLPGSNGYKLAMQNQIKAIINAKGAPTLFITLNPSDVDHPLVRVLSGEGLDLDEIFNKENIDAWDRKVHAARNPAACAKFFDLMITNFIKIILAPGNGHRGLYGTCEAYYGTVEAQGKGTLHLHLLIWLRGHPPPQILRERLRSSEEYKKMFTEWLESIIMNEFPTISASREDEPNRDKRIRCNEFGEPHPGTIRGPILTTERNDAADDFWILYKEHIIRLLNEYNWHKHTATCWKYLKRGEEKIDSNCRMRMDGCIIPETVVDDATGEFQLRRLHPWISSYTDLVTFLMKCNMNVQFIGSGDAAKAFIYYVTDYITKASLPAHAGLVALSYAIKKSNEQREHEDDNSQAFYTSALTKLINGMMGRQEISHPQVMSYLVGGGDHYTSEKFYNLYLGAFLRHLTNELEVLASNSGLKEINDEELEIEEDEHVYITVDEDDVSVNNQVFDYCFRPLAEPYDSMCLYDFVAKTNKVRAKNITALVNSRDAFSSAEHPQRGTHRMNLRAKPVLPVILGPSLPNRHASEETKELWAKYMLVMFKPWRKSSDLKAVEQSWTMSFEIFEGSGLLRNRKIMANMELLSDCADARFRTPRCGAPAEYTHEGNEINGDFVDNQDRRQTERDDYLQHWREQYCSDIFTAFEEHLKNLPEEVSADISYLTSALERSLGKQVSDAVNFCFQLNNNNSDYFTKEQSTERFTESIHGEEVAKHNTIMTLKRKRRLDLEEDNEIQRPRKFKKQGPDTPFVSVATLPLYIVHSNGEYETIVREITSEMNLVDNKEQLEAFLTVARHVGEREPHQLLMFVSGVGGTGKSHVIKSIVKLFERINRRKSLLLGAPTGSAAILIGGGTLHSLILESPNGRGKRNMSTLTSIWNGVKYLIIDEVSMLGASFLCKLSNVICQAKGDDIVNCNRILGGVNVIFMGDFCQLKPPLQRALYASSIIKGTAYGHPRDEDIEAINGILIWRQVNKVVELVKNCRHASDVKYSEFLSRLRVGNCVSAISDPNAQDDYKYLQSRLLCNILWDNPAELTSFREAPFIVGSKALRDMLNARSVAYHASRLNQDVHTYHSKDSSRRVTLSSEISEYLWSLHSSHVRDSFGRLPLFKGMKVMVTENIAFDSKVVNGTEGIVHKILYEEDDEGRRYATVVYLLIEGIGFNIPGLDPDIVPIFPVKTRIDHAHLDVIGLDTKGFTRLQLPLIPAYAYTDFKSQGRTLTKAIVDIVTACGQGVYVMLSRVTSLSGVAILRWFPPSKIHYRLSEELREELHRLRCRM